MLNFFLGLLFFANFPQSFGYIFLICLSALVETSREVK